MKLILRIVVLIVFALGTAFLSTGCVEESEAERPIPLPFDGDGDNDREADGDGDSSSDPDGDSSSDGDSSPDPDGDSSPDPDGDGDGDPTPQGADELSGNFPFHLHCESASNNIVTLNYTISSSATSYMVMPITSNGGWLYPIRITTPSGTVIDFTGENAFQARGAQSMGALNPTIIPAAPQFQFQFETGNHSYRLQTNDTEICFYVVESTSSNSQLDLNIYPVGLDDMDITADNASTHPQLQAMISEAESILGQSGLSLGRIRYVEFPPNAVDGLRVMRDENDLFELLSHSQWPGTDVDSAMSINLFIVEQFSFSDGDGVLGVSMGAPGAAGLHETGLSGVALTGEYIGYQLHGGIDGNAFTGNIMAHELGHFLGLQHTSELDGQTYDPLEDTPECTNMSTNNLTNCPDWGNLMFPVAAPQNNTLTSDQSFVIGVNPLTK